MKRYVRFTEVDVRTLAAFGTATRSHFPAIADQFYDRIRDHEQAHAVFTGEAQIMRLRQSMVGWLERLCFGPHDESYFEASRRIGRVHVAVGLPQRYVFTGMTVLRAALDRLIDGFDPDRAVATRAALTRILDIDLCIMVESYREDLAQRLEKVARAERDELSVALARSQHRYVNAVELARVAILGLDAAGAIWLVNAEAERMTGWARDELLGRNFVDTLVPVELREEDGGRLRRALAGVSDALGRWESTLRARAGHARTVRWQLAYDHDVGDESVVLFAIGQDITESNALLERTLRNEKLAAVGTLAAGLAHEIRNPLNGALLHVTFLERALRKLPDATTDTHDAIRIVGEEIRRLSALVRDFLVFARPSMVNRKSIWLNELCRRVLDVARSDASSAQAALEPDLSHDDVEVSVDAEKIEQVLLNLLRNAIEAVGSIGGGRVVLRTRRRPRDVVIEVQDDGPGVPSQDVPIFDAFYSTKPNGTGLGLAIVQRIVSDHRGLVEVESNAGQTVFRVVLPLVGEPSER